MIDTRARTRTCTRLEAGKESQNNASCQASFRALKPFPPPPHRPQSKASKAAFLSPLSESDSGRAGRREEGGEGAIHPALSPPLPLSIAFTLCGLQELFHLQLKPGLSIYAHAHDKKQSQSDFDSIRFALLRLLTSPHLTTERYTYTHILIPSSSPLLPFGSSDTRKTIRGAGPSMKEGQMDE